ncbi:RNA ligase (ATP) [Phytoactinopolyspora mesophila]|uniref:RNA ligase (ATP) n=1 Tax=Phytoactinopolyspora mesophila TaxID=2650750 RepID=A0A7K3M7R8_9ACTN|nr:RNA ligase (ATP) [Phytoactinopolyspora mesophila]
MTSIRVTAEQLTISPHPDADSLEIAQIGRFSAVVPKGEFATGEWAVYIPEGSILPDDLIAEIGLTGQLAGVGRNRVKAIRLRGQLSQGLVCRPAALSGVDLAKAHAGGHNFADALRITKWTPPTPIHLAGPVGPAPGLLPWIEIEDIKRYPNMFKVGEPVVATEKIHGTACLYTRVNNSDFVSSKGYAKKRRALVYSQSNLYWRTILAYNIPWVANNIANMMNAHSVGIFGEIYGKGVQDLTYGADAYSPRPGYAVFDVRVETAAMGWWLDPDELVSIMGEFEDPPPLAPRLYAGPYDEDMLFALSNGSESISRTALHLREGLVARPVRERRSALTGGRAVAKFVSPAYLTREGGTEYE